MGNKNLYNIMPSSEFGIGGDHARTKKLRFDTNSQGAQTEVTLKTNPATTTDITLTLPYSTGTIALEGSGGGAGFQTIQVPAGTSPVATGPADILTLADGTGIAISGDSITDTVTIGIATGNNFAILGRDASGEAYDIPTASISSTSGGLSQTTTVEPNGAGGDQINSLWAYVNPLQNSPAAAYNLISPSIEFDPNSTGFSIGTDGTAANLLNVYAKHFGTSNIGSITYINMNSNLGDGVNTPTINGVDFVNMYMGLASGVTVSGQIRGATFAPNIPTGVTLQNGVQAFADYSQCSVEVVGWTGFTSAPNINSIANNSNYTGLNSSPSIDTFTGNAGFFGLNISPILGTFGTGGFYGINVNPQSIDSVDNATGLYINMGNVTGTNVKAIDVVGDVSITGSLAFSGALSIGQLNAFYAANVVDGGGNPTSLNSLVSQITAPASSTTANGDTLGLNTAMLMAMEANSTVTSGALKLGFSAIALPCVVETHTGSSIDYMNAAVYAINLSGTSTGGTIDNVNLCRVVAIPNGITTVTNLKGFEMDLPFGGVATNTWGVYIEPDVENYMQGSLLVGGTAGSSDTVANASVGIELSSTTRALLNARMTTTERNALTALNGMQVYNTTSDKLQVYAGGSWVDLH